VHHLNRNAAEDTLKRPGRVASARPAALASSVMPGYQCCWSCQAAATAFAGGDGSGDDALSQREWNWTDIEFTWKRPGRVASARPAAMASSVMPENPSCVSCWAAATAVAALSSCTAPSSCKSTSARHRHACHFHALKQRASLEDCYSSSLVKVIFLVISSMMGPEASPLCPANLNIAETVSVLASTTE
jgi:hypothetical protein